MPQHSDNFPSLADIDPVLAEIFYQSYRQFPQILIPAIYTERTSTKAKETDKRVGSLGDPQLWAGQVHYDEADDDYEIVYTHTHRSLGFKVDVELAEDLQYQGLFDSAAALGQSFARRTLKDEAATLENAFSATYPGYDAVALCSASHARSKTDATAVSNYYGTGALNDANLEAAIMQLEGLGDDRGEEINTMPNLLIVGRQNRKKAFELVESEYDPESAENARNIHYGLQFLVDPYISGKKWFVADQAMARQYLKWFWRVRPTYESVIDKGGTLMTSFYGRMRSTAGWSDFRWLVGSNAS